MDIIEVLLVSVGLAMDAFAVSLCKGLSMKRLSLKKVFLIALYFGLFQSIMPLIGYLLASSIGNIIINVDHWIVFILLIIIGGNMISEALSKEVTTNNDKVDFNTMVILSLATSVDALALGITFAFLKVDIFKAITLIGLITFLLCLIGVKMGHKFGNKYEKKAQFIGGLILIFMGFKILFEHCLH